MLQSKDYFEKYLEHFPDAPSLVLVRSVELKNFPSNFRKAIWRKVLKPIYLNSEPLDFGGELVIVAKKSEK